MASKSGRVVGAAVVLLLAGGARTLCAQQGLPPSSPAPAARMEEALEAMAMREEAMHASDGAAEASLVSLEDGDAGDPGDESPADRIDALYEEGTSALDEQHWDDAIRAFDEVVKMKGARLDGALYWRAYAQRKAGRKAEARASIAELRRAAPRSKWVKDADMLEMELQQDAGVRPQPEAAADEDVKLIAIQALMNGDSARAVRLLEDVLGSPRNSRKLRDKALFVLAQNDAPAAQALLLEVARGQRGADLQRSAIRYLGLSGSQQTRNELRGIYAAGDEEVKKSVLQAYMMSDDRANTLQVARGEKSAALRRAAIHQLGAMGAQPELWQMYGSETDLEVKKAILQGMFIGGGDQRLIELSRSETNPELRRVVVRNLGIMDRTRTGPRLVELYETDADPQIRRQALDGLFVQNNATALVRLAKAEKDPARRRDIVQKLSVMDNEEAREYLMELLK